MMPSKLLQLVLTTIFVLALFSACQDSEPPKSKIYNPNGDSELALKMRSMFDAYAEVKRSYLEGDPDWDVAEFNRIHKLEGTEPDKVKGKMYQAMAKAYYSAEALFQAASFIHKKDAFNATVDQCMSCHGALCPGPMVKIKKLYIR